MSAGKRIKDYVTDFFLYMQNSSVFSVEASVILCFLCNEFFTTKSNHFHVIPLFACFSNCIINTELLTDPYYCPVFNAFYFSILCFLAESTLKRQHITRGWTTSLARTFRSLIILLHIVFLLASYFSKSLFNVNMDRQLLWNLIPG